MGIKTIELKKKEKDFLKGEIEKIKDAHTGFTESCRFQRAAYKGLWDKIAKIHPECIGDEQRANFNHETFVIIYYDNKK